ncbi:MAG TPA: hypothetical protein VIM24_02870 [Candidatus Limnocylindrales bacterium]
MNDRPNGWGEPDRDVLDRPAGAPVTVRLSSAGRGPGIAVGLIAIFVAVALIKPWAFGDAAVPRPTPRLTAAPTAVPSVDPLAALRVHCQEPAGWRIYSRERWAKVTVRSWRSLEPAHGVNGPLDPAIPIVPVGAQVDALGYCSPWDAGERPPDAARVDGWRIATDGRGGTTAETIRLQPFDPSWPSILGALYGPPVDRFDSNAVETIGWPGGRYVFAIRALGYQRWWGVDVEPPPAADATDGPAASARPASP